MYQILTLNLNEMSTYCRGSDERMYFVTDTRTSQEGTLQEVTREAMNESVFRGGHENLTREVHLKNLRQITLWIRLQRIKQWSRKRIIEQNTLERISIKPELLDELADRLENDEVVE